MFSTSAAGTGDITITLDSPGVSPDITSSVMIFYRGFKLSEYDATTQTGSYSFQWAGTAGESNVVSILVRETTAMRELDAMFSTNAVPTIDVLYLGATGSL